MELLIDQDQPLLTRIIYELLKIQIPHLSLIGFINFVFSILFVDFTLQRNKVNQTNIKIVQYFTGK